MTDVVVYITVKMYPCSGGTDTGRTCVTGMAVQNRPEYSL